jgi:hypothetical protein
MGEYFVQMRTAENKNPVRIASGLTEKEAIAMFKKLSDENPAIDYQFGVSLRGAF